MDNQENFEDNLLEDDSEEEWIEWERSRTRAVVQVICQVIHALHIKYRSYRRRVVTPSILEQRTREENRVQFRLELMDHIKRFPGACHHLTRISPRALQGLCQIFRNKGVIKDSRRTSIEEKVIISLVILGHGHTIRALSVFFRRSLEAVNRYFHQVLRALILLEDEFLRQLDGTSISPEIQNSTRFYPYFKVIINFCTCFAIDVMTIQEKNVEKRDLIRWTKVMDEVLIDALVYEDINGSKLDGVFTTQALNDVVKEVREKTKVLEVDKEKVKNRIKSLKKKFTQCYDIFKHTSGFSWSPITKKFDAEPEVWEKLIEAHPHAKKFMNVEILHYDKLLSLYAKDRATGDYAETAKEKASRWAKMKDGTSTMNNNIEDIDRLVASQEFSLENFDDLDGHESEPVTPTPTPTPQVNIKSHSVTSPNKRKRKTSQKDYSEVRVALESVAKQLEKGNTIADERNEIAKKTRVRVYSEEEVYEELLRIGVEAYVRYKAYDFLTEDAARVRKFFGCPVPERKDYLMHRMYGTSI